MSAIDPTLLSARASLPDDDALLAADPSGAWGALVRLRADTATDLPAAVAVPDAAAIAAWSGDEAAPANDPVPYYAARSLLLAELLEGTLEQLPAEDARQLAAAPARATVDPWPARYRGGGWTVVLGVDEAGWLYYAIEGAADGAPADGELRLSDIDLQVPTALTPGTASGLGDASELLGSDDVNPLRTVIVDGLTLPRDDA
ncbi:MAG: hypothetical protein GY898_29450 [Proteobacteria bacterium]|nr:hypothetical protein [Pseudomonadota bacterium]